MFRLVPEMLLFLSRRVIKEEGLKVDVGFRHPVTGQVRMVKIGWSWTMFFFSTFWGIIWFIRGLMDFGWTIVAINVIGVSMFSIEIAAALQKNFALVTFTALGGWVLGLGQFGFGIWAGIKGNEVTAKRYLKKGYELIDPNNDIVKYAKMKWGMFGVETNRGNGMDI